MEVIIQAINAELEAPVVMAQITGGHLVLSWDAVAGATSYRVEARTTYDTPWVDVSAEGTFEGESWQQAIAGSETRILRVLAVSGQ